MSSISAMKAKAINDAAMGIITTEKRERDAKTARLRALRLALEAETGAVDRVAIPRVKTKLSVRAAARRTG